MGLYWLQPGWTDATCGCCGSRIAPEGDPDWGLCWPCMQAETERQHQQRQMDEGRRTWENEQMEQYYRDHPHG